MTISITMPWPKREAFPNARGHRIVRHRAAKAMKENATLRAHAEKGLNCPKGGKWTIDMVFRPPGRCDDDNLVAACKPYRDGIAAALGTDDRNFSIGKVQIIRPGQKPGYVRLELTQI